VSELKAEIKMATAHHIGAKLDDQLDAANSEVQRYDGAKEALKQAVKTLEGLMLHVDKDIDEGKYEELAGSLGPLKIAELVKLYIQRSMSSVQNLAIGAETSSLVARGKAQALQLAVKTTKDIFDTEAKKKAAIEEAMKSGTLIEENRPEGVHPGKMSAVQELAARRAEAKAAKNAKEAENPQTATESSDSVAVPSSNGANGHTPKGRKKK
jgi:septum formation inhibitor MinC